MILKDKVTNSTLFIKVIVTTVKKQLVNECLSQADALLGWGTCGNATTSFVCPHPTFKNYTLVAMMVSIRMCYVPHHLNCLDSPLIAST